MVVEKLYSPRAVAAAIGVSESSLKRWADEGKIRVVRTEGGHRRIPLREALRYIRQGGIPLVNPGAIGLADVEAARIRSEGADPEAEIAEALAEGDGERLRGLLVWRYLDGESPSALCDGPVTGALHRLGDLWRHGTEGIVLEHRATEACIHALNVLRSLLPPVPAEAPLALGGSPAGDPYRIPSLMAALVLAADGWREINLGADVPVPALVSAMETHRPRLVWLSFSSEEAASRMLRESEDLRTAVDRLEAMVAVGGRVAPGGKLEALSSRFHALSSMEAYQQLVEITLEPGDTIVRNIQLQPDAITFEEFVVVGYGTQQKKVVTGAISSINADDIASLPVLRVEQAMQGKAAGVQVTNLSGQPGEAPTVRIRGAGTTGKYRSAVCGRWNGCGWH